MKKLSEPPSPGWESEVGKGRIVYPEFFEDLDVGGLSRDERLLLAGMIVACADDYGRFVADARYLKAKVFPYDEDITTDKVSDMRNRILEICRNVTLYQVNGQDYLYFANWDKFQHYRHPINSRIPPPSDGQVTDKCRTSDGQVTAEVKRREENRIEENTRADKRRASSSEHQKLMDAYQIALGYQIPNGGQEGKAAKKILAAGYSIEDAIGCYSHLKADQFWEGKHLSLTSVLKQIGPWKQGGNGDGWLTDAEMRALENGK